MVEVLITKSLRDKLETYTHNGKVENPNIGRIMGWNRNGVITCLGCSATDRYFPSGIQTVGTFLYTSAFVDITEKMILGMMESLLKNSEELLHMEQGIILCVSRSLPNTNITIEVRSCSFASCYLGDLLPFSLIDIELQKPMLFRARGEIELNFEAAENNDKGIQEKSITAAFERLQHIFNSSAAFHLRNSLLLLQDFQDDEENLLSDLECCRLKEYLEKNDNYQKQKQNKRKYFDFSKQEVLNLDILLQMSSDRENCIPVIHYQRKNFHNVTVPLFVDILAIVQENHLVSHLVKILITGIIHQLDEMRRCLLKFQKNTKYLTPVPYHFWPAAFDYPLTVVYPYDMDDKQLESSRKELHLQLFLPVDRPFLRLANRHYFPDETDDTYLQNPHIGLSASGVTDGKPAIIWGTYTYHHYMQDRIDDSGWGCAYRSLQTIVSWFRHQGHTKISIPTHKEIQQALVTIGDKPASFVGSKKWIGSQEVSYCLDHFIGKSRKCIIKKKIPNGFLLIINVTMSLFQITSKIMFVSSGADLLTKGRELTNHFLTQGTPIMIGGGMLAHTILGVDFNEVTGELKFLVLDPHYTGAEEINIIQNKGWCGWKDIAFWESSSFYNLCMPQRPIEL